MLLLISTVSKNIQKRNNPYIQFLLELDTLGGTEYGNAMKEGISMSDRLKLETAIEREVFKLVSQIKEHMHDHTMIYLNRTQSDINRDTAERVLQIAQDAVEDGLMSKIDFLKKGIHKSLNEFTETDNPLQPGKQGMKT